MKTGRIATRFLFHDQRERTASASAAAQDCHAAFDLAIALESRHWLRQFSQASVQRALRYAHSGAWSVLHIEWLNSVTVGIRSQVQGTARQSYRTTVEIFATGNRFDYACECSCPVGIDCKHAAALLMAAVAMHAGDPAAAPAPARPSLRLRPHAARRRRRTNWTATSNHRQGSAQPAET